MKKGRRFGEKIKRTDTKSVGTYADEGFLLSIWELWPDLSGGARRGGLRRRMNTSKHPRREGEARSDKRNEARSLGV